jgi:hypothetical protein
MATNTPPLSPWLAHIRSHVDAITAAVHEPQTVESFAELSPEVAAAYFRLVDTVSALDLVTHRLEGLLRSR